MTAWALSYPLKRFLAVVLTGKILKFVGFAYTCDIIGDWLVRFFPASQ